MFSAEDLSNHEKVLSIPFTGTHDVWPERLSVSKSTSTCNTLKYFGRNACSGLLKTILNLGLGLRSPHNQPFNQSEAQQVAKRGSYKGLFVDGLPGGGKSYMIAAIASFLLREFLSGRVQYRTVYIPDCSLFLTNPLNSPQCALIIAHCDEPEVMRQISEFDSKNQVDEFISGREYVFMFDQFNKLTDKPEAHLVNELVPKHYVVVTSSITDAKYVMKTRSPYLSWHLDVSLSHVRMNYPLGTLCTLCK